MFLFFLLVTKIVKNIVLTKIAHYFIVFLAIFNKKELNLQCQNKLFYKIN